MSFSELPLEILEEIHYQVLNDLDIATVLEDPLPVSSEHCWDCKSVGYHVLDPATLSLIYFYRKLFISGSQIPIWQEHVRFLFPSILAMADVLYEIREAGLLTRIRKIKVLHTAGLLHTERQFGISKPFNIAECVTTYDIMQEY